MKINPTCLQGAFLIEPEPFMDNRGVFARVFCQKELQSVLGSKKIVQINHSLTRHAGAVRGMHFQKPPRAEIKIIKCIRGRVFDVMVDLRKGSPTLLKWQGEMLSENNMKMMFIPEGFAHGFQVVEDNSELLYMHTEFYNSGSEAAIRFDDPRVSIEWPLEVTDISEKDKGHSLLENGFQGIDI